MMMPSIFRENLFDDFMDDPMDELFTLRRNPIFGKREKNLLKTDVKEKDGFYELDMDLPGFKKDEVSAKLEDGYLTIQATKGMKKDEKGKEGKYIRKERYSGSAARSFYVGESIKQEDIKANFKNGILHLRFPKEEPAKMEGKKYISIEG